MDSLLCGCYNVGGGHWQRSPHWIFHFSIRPRLSLVFGFWCRPRNGCVPFLVISGRFLAGLGPGLSRPNPASPGARRPNMDRKLAIWSERGPQKRLYGVQRPPSGLQNPNREFHLFQSCGASCLIAAGCCLVCKPAPLTLTA